MKKKKPSEEFQTAIKAIRRRKHSRMPSGYRKDPKEYNIPLLAPRPTCENCKSPFKEDREVMMYGYTRQDKACLQKKVCAQWTLVPQETEGSI